MNTKQHTEYWVIPPECNAEFVAHMENVLETYEKPYDASHPVVCMDEQPVQLIKETRQPIPATKDHPRRVDYVQLLSSCFANHSMVGDKQPLGNTARNSTGPRKLLPYWTESMQTVTKSRLSATT